MKKTLAIILLPLFAFAFQSNYAKDLNGYVKNVTCDKVLHKDTFDICYSYNNKEPLAVAYDLKGSDLKKHHYSRKHNTFYSDVSLPIKDRSYSKNYVHTGYDRGHHIPNAARNYDKRLQKATFVMSNISPQAKWLNRAYWAKAERFARIEAIRYGEVEVITGNCGSNGHISNGVNIPKYWYKMIYIPKQGKLISFLTPNTNKGMKTAKLKEYQVSAQEIQTKCGFNEAKDKNRMTSLWFTFLGLF